MTTKRPEAIAAIAGTMRSSVSRRRLLQAAGIGSAAMVAAACGTGGDSEASGEAASAEDMSDTDKTLNWSNWPLYIDVDEDSGVRPTLEAFQSESGVAVTYTEDINDNNEFYAKVRTQLEQGQDIGRDLVVLTDWMAALWIQNGFAQKLDKSIMPNAGNIIPRLKSVSFDPNREYTLPWQSGIAGFGFNKSAYADATGNDKLVTLDQLFDPAIKGRVTLLTEMRDTMGVLLASLGYDPANFTDDEFSSAIELLTNQVDSGQVRQVTGNDYIAALESGDVIGVIGWSGDILALGEDFGFEIPESGGTLWTDNMEIPALAQHKKNAELAMNYYYDPEVAAEVAAYVNYICPVEGAQEAMEALDPELASDEFIFPTQALLDQTFIFMELTVEQNDKYEREFQKTIGN
ncbi:MAG: extracellular solute-binding protein [Candidatus Nanopelagicales bacterium]|nr:extracellular solute-binding protein [Candidatus Nanopelagicales bacterium]MCF8537850.1 extracellular solute-binding protein [Candidatus Nanopelagicales bacterium]MCF8543186.1 extracellular solute-binding protein [Candidatus Nanopelagicales bacterium]